MSYKITSFDKYKSEYKNSIEKPDLFWDSIANNFLWRKKWTKTLEWEFSTPKIKWFLNGRLNITENCIDRHLKNKSDDVAIIWEPNNPKEKVKKITYRTLFNEVCKFSNVLKNNGINKGDRVCLYMPMIPELAYAVLACARIGAIHSVVFAGFSSKSLADRINDSSCKLVITSDGSYRGTKQINLKSVVDNALQTCPCVEIVLVVKRTKEEIDIIDGRDKWLHDEIKMVSDVCEAQSMDSEDMLFILYTSGSTGKPKGMVHTCGGFMVYSAYSFQNVFQYNSGDIYWCTADIGWITGHSYIIYGPLLNGATTVMFEGVPSYPDMGRFWEIVEKHKVNIFYTAPTAIRSLSTASLDLVNKYNLSSLKVLGTVGEPINEEAWNWYYKNIGKENCPICDTWWQTETGGIMISSLAGITPVKATYATLPLPGISPCLLDEKGQIIDENNAEGRLCISKPWPSIARTIYNDHKRYKETYFSSFNNMYFTGDGCKRDENGFYRITGRVDDVIIVSGHNIGTAEVEDAIDLHKDVCETAVVGYPHIVKGHSIYAFITCYDKDFNKENRKEEIIDIVSKNIGPIAKPEKIQFVADLPKTRSGKIMRRILRKIAANKIDELGDTSTLLNPKSVEEIKKKFI